MIDFWEAIGRLATYKDLNNEFLAVLPPVGTTIPHVSVTAKTLDARSVGLVIPQDHYERVQNFFSPILTENYLSLMSAGELIMTYSFEKSRAAMLNLLELIPQATPELFGPSTRYFITLGILIVDEIFRHNLQNKGPDAIKVIRRLADPENEVIATLANNSKFQDLAAAFSASPWDGGCDARLIYWPGHLHPVGIDSETWQSGNGTAYQKSTAARTS